MSLTIFRRMKRVTLWWGKIQAPLRLVPDLLKTQEMYNEAVRIEPILLASLPDHFKTQETWNEVEWNIPCMLLFVPDHFKTRGMCSKIMRKTQAAFYRIPDPFKTQEMCIKAVEADPWQLKDVLDRFKTQEMCNKAVSEGGLFFCSMSLIGLWPDEYDDEFFKWYKVKWHEDYQKRKTQKALMK